MKRKIYGVSSKFAFGEWQHCVYFFENKENAEEWLNTEECDFRERELMTKTEVIRLAGRKNVECAGDGDCLINYKHEMYI